MAKGDNAVYRVTDVIGTSPNSWEDAAKNAVKTAAAALTERARRARYWHVPAPPA